METIVLKIQNLRLDWVAIGHGAVLMGVAGLVLMAGLAVSLWLVGRSMARDHRQLKGELARIFEQLDLLRLDAQQGLAATELQPVASAMAAPAAAPLPGAVQHREAVVQSQTGDYRHDASDYHAAAEIAERCGIVGGEARVLVALQQARARRAEAA